MHDNEQDLGWRLSSPARYCLYMATNDYHFITRWRVRSTLEEITEVIGNAPDLVRWWPSVYLDVKVLEPGAANGLGRVVSLFTKGWLPYTLRWQFTVTEVNAPHGFRLDAVGDFAGRGIWTFAQDGEYVNITYDWKISAEKGLLKHLSFLMKPLFSANHQWAMRKGLESLQLELRRRHAVTDAERAQIPPPPGPTFAWFIRPGNGAETRVLPRAAHPLS
jgi:hypothetical protein